MVFSGSFSHFITNAVGNRRTNYPDDVRKTKHHFAHLGYLEDDIQNGFITRELDTSIRHFQRDKGLHIDGQMNPGGETERALSRRLSKELAPPPAPIKLSGSVGKMKTNRPHDVRQVQRTLGHLNFMPAITLFEPGSIIDSATDAGIRNFQRSQNLREDGILFPGGETQLQLNQHLFTQLDEKEGGDDSDDGGDKGEGKAPDNPDKHPEKPPIPPKKPEPPKNPKKDCSAQEKTVQDAQQKRETAKQALEEGKERIAPQKDSLQSEMDALQEELDLMIRVQEPTKRAIKGISVTGGAIGGGLIGRSPSSAVSGAKIGDEIGDAAKRILEAKIIALAQKIENLQGQIDKLDDELLSLDNAVADAEDALADAEDALLQCQSQGDDNN